MTLANNVREVKKQGLLDHQLFSLLVIGFCFILGLTLTFLLYLSFIKMDNELVHQQTLRAAQILAETAPVIPMDPNTLKGFEMLNQLHLDLMQNPVLNKTVLGSYLWDTESPLISFSLRYLPKTRYNQSEHQYETMQLTGDWVGLAPDITIRDALPDVLNPPLADGSAEEYFPVLLHAEKNDIGFTSIGLNHFSDPLFHLIMDQARDAGFVTSRTSFPRKDSSEGYIINFNVQPLYSPGEIPQTVSERRRRLVGFLEFVVFSEAASFIEFLPESYLGLDTAFILESEAMNNDNLDTELQEILASDQFSHESFELQGFTTHIYARPSSFQRQDMQTNNRWWALSIGLLITGWFCSMLLVNRNRSLNMQKIVSARTADLAERSHKLEEVNAALKNSESRYRMLADNVNDLILTRDMDGICTYISPSVTSLLGYSVDEFLGKKINDFLTKESQLDVSELEKNFLERSSEAINEKQLYEYGIRNKQGETCFMEATVSVLKNEQNQINGYLIVSRDITERKKQQKEKQVLEQTVQQAQKMEAVGTLAGGIAHDFNNLLTGILGHAELIKMTSDINPSTEKSVDVIENAALRGKELTTQLLGFARKGRFQEKAVDVNKMVGETILLVERTIDKKITIKHNFSSDVPVIVGDPGQISQVLVNLAVNARDAMPEGGELKFTTSITIITENSSHLPVNLPPGKYCVISVSDTGIGIQKEKLSRIFEPFYSDKEEGKGTGLGLAMVYGVATNHNGTVSVSSIEGQGTDFKVYLPLSKQQVKHSDSIQIRKTISGTGKILIVDDEEMVRKLAETMLEQMGYETVVAENGVVGLDYYRQHWESVDLVIMDLIMPDMGGLECLRNMSKVNPQLRAIIATGYTPDTIKDNLNEEYILSFLQKPFMLQDLSEKVFAGIKFTH